MLFLKRRAGEKGISLSAPRYPDPNAGVTRPPVSRFIAHHPIRAVLHPLFSHTYKHLLPQLPSFDTNCRVCVGPKARFVRSGGCCGANKGRRTRPRASETTPPVSPAPSTLSLKGLRNVSTFRRSNVLTPVESALTQNTPITPLESALPNSLDLKSFGIRTYEKRWGEGLKLLTSRVEVKTVLSRLTLHASLFTSAFHYVLLETTS